MAEKKVMKIGSFHHQMTTVKDMDAMIHLYRDVLGMELTSRVVVPDDAIRPADGAEGTKAVMGDDIDRIWEIATLDSNQGACIELCHPIYPPVVCTPPETRGYGYLGHSERGFAVEDIDAWYDWIVENGYVPQSRPWQAGPNSRTFVFFDPEGNMIQLYEDMEHPTIPRWERMCDIVDLRKPEQIPFIESTYKD